MKKVFDLIIMFCMIMFIYVLAFVLQVAFDKEEPKEEPVQIIYETIAAEEPVDLEVQVIINPREEYLQKLDEVNAIEDSLEWFKAFKSLNEEYAEQDEIEWISDVYSEDEIYLLERMVETECHGADFESKTHVAAVALNRVENERFPDTLTGVLTQANQFTYGKTSIDDETKLAVEYAYCVATPADDCLWFHSMAKKEKFSGGDYVFSDKCHHFYK